MKTYLLFLSALAFSLLLCCSSCDLFRDAASTDYSIDTLTHSSYDFSAGLIPTDYNFADGETIGWCPDGQNPDYSSNDKWIWWRTSDYTTEFQKDFGNVDLYSITSAPDVWDNVINPLLKGHCYVVKCNDGYAKFKVLSVGFHDWDVEVEFMFSDSDKF